MTFGLRAKDGPEQMVSIFENWYRIAFNLNLKRYLICSLFGGGAMGQFGQYLVCPFLFAFLLADMGCGSGSGSGTQPPVVPDFTLGVTPGTLVVTAGSNAQFQVGLSAQNGFSGSVTVVVNGLPSGVTMSPASGFTLSAGNPQNVTLTA